MIRLFLICLSLAVCGCVSTQQKLTLAHDIDVPKNYRSGLFSKDHPYYTPGDSTIERYIWGYEYGWVTAVEKYGKNIDFNPDLDVFRGANGWEEEVVGSVNGFDAASCRIKSLIRVYGKQRVSEFLKEEWPPEAYLHKEK